LARSTPVRPGQRGGTGSRWPAAGTALLVTGFFMSGID